MSVTLFNMNPSLRRRTAVTLTALLLTLLTPVSGSLDSVSAATAGGTLAWPHFLQIHVENARADTRIIVDSGWAGVRYASQPGVQRGDYLLRIDESGYVRSLDNKAVFTIAGTTAETRLVVYLQFPARDGADAFVFVPGRQLAPPGAFLAGGTGNTVTDVQPYVPTFALPMEFEITVRGRCRDNQYLQVAPEWTRTVWRTPDGIGPGTYRVRLNADFTVTAPDGSAAWSQIPARPEDWDHAILGVLIVHSCDRAGDGADIVGYGRNPNGTLQHMTTWAQTPDAGYGWLPFNSISGSYPRPDGFFGGNQIIQVPVGSAFVVNPPPPPLGSLPTLKGDVPLIGDWDGDNRSSIGVRRGSTWYLRNTNDAGGVHASFDWGSPSDLPVVGDWNGDNTETPGVFRSGVWYLRNSNSGGGVDITFPYGEPGDIPVVGDWDGNGSSTIGVRRGATWYLRNDNSAGPPDAAFEWGAASDLPVTGDWDGSGTTTIGVRRGATWYLRNDNNAGGVDGAFSWGAASDVALVGDWDGNGTATIGVRRSASWFLRNNNSSGGVDAAFPWGQPTVIG